MTFLEAAIEVLRNEPEPLHFAEIAKRAVDRHLLSHVGRDPEAAMRTCLNSAVRGDQALLVRNKPGYYAIRPGAELPPPAPVAAPAAPVAEPEPAKRSSDVEVKAEKVEAPSRTEAPTEIRAEARTEAAPEADGDPAGEDEGEEAEDEGGEEPGRTSEGGGRRKRRRSRFGVRGEAPPPQLVAVKPSRRGADTSKRSEVLQKVHQLEFEAPRGAGLDGVTDVALVMANAMSRLAEERPELRSEFENMQRGSSSPAPAAQADPRQGPRKPPLPGLRERPGSSSNSGGANGGGYSSGSGYNNGSGGNGSGSSAGGSAADDAVAGGWYQLTRDGDYRDAVVVSALFPSGRVVSAFQSGYVPSDTRGVVTRARGRTLIEIDGQPAAAVYDAWTRGAIAGTLGVGGSVLASTSLFPLGRRVGDVGGVPYYRLAHPATVHPDGSIDLFADVEAGDELVLMHGDVEALVTRAGRVAADARALARLAPAEVAGALVIFCAGCMLTVRDRLEQVVVGLREGLGGAPFLGSFTFGEQGCFIGGENRHGNLMISVTVFARA